MQHTGFTLPSLSHNRTRASKTIGKRAQIENGIYNNIIMKSFACKQHTRDGESRERKTASCETVLFGFSPIGRKLRMRLNFTYPMQMCFEHPFFFFRHIQRKEKPDSPEKRENTNCSPLSFPPDLRKSNCIINQDKPYGETHQKCHNTREYV